VHKQIIAGSDDDCHRFCYGAVPMTTVIVSSDAVANLSIAPRDEQCSSTVK
jgi:hypothetical protein